MANSDTEATSHYHDGTKHPGGYLLNPYHVYDGSTRPRPYKIYEEGETIPLPLDKSARGMSALQAIALGAPGAPGQQVPDLQTVARLLYFSAGITKRIDFGPRVGEMAFRAASCTGALYHIELYVVCGDLPGLEAGVYHFNPRGPALTRLRRGDYRHYLVRATGGAPAAADAPLFLIYSDDYARNAVKYQAREYRHAFWDSGTILSHTLALAAAHDLPSRLLLAFADEVPNRLLDLDTDREFVLALLPVGRTKQAPPEDVPLLEPLSLRVARGPGSVSGSSAILEMHGASSLASRDEAAAWREAEVALTLPEPLGHSVPLDLPAQEDVPQDALETVIVRRGSSRRFKQQPITFPQLSLMLQRSTQGIPADFGAGDYPALNHAYVIATAVEGLPSGAYVYHPSRQELELLQEDDVQALREESGRLALGQALGADAAVNVYFLSELEPILARYGNRGYRAAQMEASIMAGRLYLAAYAQQLGATGLTFFDDAVTEFFSPHAAGKSVTFLMALGHPAHR